MAVFIFIAVRLVAVLSLQLESNHDHHPHDPHDPHDPHHHHHHHCYHCHNLLSSLDAVAADRCCSKLYTATALRRAKRCPWRRRPAWPHGPRDLRPGRVGTRIKHDQIVQTKWRKIRKIAVAINQWLYNEGVIMIKVTKNAKVTKVTINDRIWEDDKSKEACFNNQ